MQGVGFKRGAAVTQEEEQVASRGWSKFQTPLRFLHPEPPKSLSLSGNYVLGLVHFGWGGAACIPGGRLPDRSRES